LPGAGGVPARIFTGHLDVVPVSDAERARWASDPFAGAIRDGRLHGRGATDMKGGLAAMVVAASELARERRTPPGDVLLALTADEEDLMAGSKAVARHPLLARDADVVVGEPTGLRVCTAGRGRTWAKLTLRGATGHGSAGSGRNVIQIAAELIAALDAEDFSATATADSAASFWRPLAMARVSSHASSPTCAP
jgi:succinyl-diaminopimelate desuccinylase